MGFPPEEVFDMLRAYFQSNDNATVAARLYALEYPDRRHPSVKVFLRIVNRIRTTGSMFSLTRRRRRTIHTEENIVNVLAYVQFNPHLSTRAIARDLGITRTTVQRILKELK